LYEAWEKKVQELIDLDTEQKGENRADMFCSILMLKELSLFFVIAKKRTSMQTSFMSYGIRI
jgi:hypothetical protein